MWPAMPWKASRSPRRCASATGEVQVTDGPFAETKEYLAGYYLLDCPDLDVALDHASRMPNIPYGSVEVRPVWDRTGPPLSSREELRARA